MDGTCTLFAPIVEHLASDCTSISYPTDQALDYEQLIDFVRARLPQDEPFILLGESFSGPVAVALAASNPPGLIGLILCASFAQSPYPSLKPFARFVRLLPMNLPLSFFSTMLMGRYTTPKLKQLLGAALQSVSSYVLRERIRSILTVDYLWKLREAKVPVLYLKATHDRVVPPSATEAFRMNVQNGTIVEIIAPHFVLQCCPKEAAGVINPFLAELIEGR